VVLVEKPGPATAAVKYVTELGVSEMFENARERFWPAIPVKVK
jgi:hypothetical protein